MNKKEGKELSDNLILSNHIERWTFKNQPKRNMDLPVLSCFVSKRSFLMSTETQCIMGSIGCLSGSEPGELLQACVVFPFENRGDLSFPNQKGKVHSTISV